MGARGLSRIEGAEGPNEEEEGERTNEGTAENRFVAGNGDFVRSFGREGERTTNGGTKPHYSLASFRSRDSRMEEREREIETRGEDDDDNM